MFARYRTATSSVSESNKKGRGAIFICARELRVRSLHSSNEQIEIHEGLMKKLLLLPLVAIGLALVPAKQADAQVSIGVGGVGFRYPAYRYGYYGYPGYNGYYHRGYYNYYGGYPYNRTYYYNGSTYYRQHRHNHYYNR